MKAMPGKVVNLTPHDIVLWDGNKTVIPKSGKVARVVTRRMKVGELNGFPVYKEAPIGVEGLPDPEPGKAYVVSLPVLQAVGENRPDVVAPDTSPEGAVRDENGKIIGVTGFRTLSGSLAPDNVNKTEEYKSGLRANRAREVVEVLNKENVVDVKSVYVKNGKWSHHLDTYYYKGRLYILGYSHSTHPVAGELWLHIWDENGKVEKYWQSTDADYLKLHLRAPRYAEKVIQFAKAYTPELYERSVKLGMISA